MCFLLPETQCLPAPFPPIVQIWLRTRGESSKPDPTAPLQRSTHRDTSSFLLSGIRTHYICGHPSPPVRDYPNQPLSVPPYTAQ
ncbi:hypothetical protein BDW22DRAFT_465987 [Trametopsis cervina]|nr:hypothetical protein BDW22DRAFT_465987 [Trametopsis cervina]